MVTVAVLLVVALIAGGTPSASAPDVPSSSAATPHVLVFGGTQSFRHSSIEVAKVVLPQLAEETGAFTMDYTEDFAAINLQNLRQYDIVFWVSPSGYSVDRFGIQPAQGCSLPDALDGITCTSAPFTYAQRAEFIDWVRCGGGVVGAHQVMDAWHDWPAWDELVGGVFDAHHENADAVLNILNEHPITAPFGSGSFNLTDEYYTYQRGPAELSSDYVPMIGFDRWVEPKASDANYSENAPMAWTSTFRHLNRTFITNLGHNDATWQWAPFQQHVVAGIRWVGEMRPDPQCLA
jgi:type 1 glutamine amidotransferase